MHPAPQRNIVHTQNFLHNPRLVARLIHDSSLGPDDCVLEIGAGKGIITAALARHCRRVVAVEKDPLLAQALRAQYAQSASVTIRTGDFLQMSLPAPPYKVFANIPFNYTAEIIQRLTIHAQAPDDIYLAVQREAAARFLGQPCETLRSILLKPWFAPSLVYTFRRTDFIPAPQVEVVMLRLNKRGPPLICSHDAQLYRDLATYLFTAWKPSLRLALGGLLSHRQIATLDQQLSYVLDSPPTAVAFEQWLTLFTYVLKTAPASTRQIVSGSDARLLHQQVGLQKCHRTRCRSTHKARR